VTVTYNRLVQTDIREICEYYDSRVDGLGDAFFEEFESVVESIIENPKYWPPIADGSNKRKASFKRFPYVLAYRIVSSERIRIFVVKHRKRASSVGMRRR